MALLVKLEKYLYSSDYQFGFKSKHPTDLCIYTLTEVNEFYKSQSSSMYVCCMDASKAFDRVGHWTLFMGNSLFRNVYCDYRGSSR